MCFGHSQFRGLPIFPAAALWHSEVRNLRRFQHEHICPWKLKSCELWIFHYMMSCSTCLPLSSRFCRLSMVVPQRRNRRRSLRSQTSAFRLKGFKWRVKIWFLYNFREGVNPYSSHLASRETKSFTKSPLSTIVSHSKSWSRSMGQVMVSTERISPFHDGSLKKQQTQSMQTRPNHAGLSKDIC